MFIYLYFKETNEFHVFRFIVIKSPWNASEQDLNLLKSRNNFLDHAICIWNTIISPTGTSLDYSPKQSEPCWGPQKYDMSFDLCTWWPQFNRRICF